MTLTDAAITKKVTSLRQKHGKVYAPLKYFRGLRTLGDVETRYLKMLRKDYGAFETDVGVKTKKSSWTQLYHRKYPGAGKSLPEISRATKVPLKTLKTVYDRGLAAWRTGHRPGASPQAWAFARVHSFVMKGKTWRTADKNLRVRVDTVHRRPA